MRNIFIFLLFIGLVAAGYSKFKNKPFLTIGASPPQSETTSKPADKGKPVTKSDVDRIVASSKNKVLLMFWHPQCSGCILMEPIVQRIEQEYPKVTVVRINTFDGESQEVHDEYGVNCTPTFVVLENGYVTARNNGPFRDEQDFVAFLKPSTVY